MPSGRKQYRAHTFIIECRHTNGALPNYYTSHVYVCMYVHTWMVCVDDWIIRKCIGTASCVRIDGNRYVRLCVRTVYCLAEMLRAVQKLVLVSARWFMICVFVFFLWILCGGGALPRKLSCISLRMEIDGYQNLSV